MKILTKLLYAAKKGVLTTAIISSVLASCNFDPKTDESIKGAIEKSQYEIVDSTQLSQTKDENTATYEDTLNKIKSIKAISPKQDTLQNKVIEYIMNDNMIDYLKNTLLPNYEDNQPGEGPDEPVKEELIKRIKETNKLKKEIISLTSPEYFNIVDQISKKLITQYHIEDLKIPSDIISIITPSAFLKLGFNKIDFIKNWDKLVPDKLEGWY